MASEAHMTILHMLMNVVLFLKPWFFENVLRDWARRGFIFSPPKNKHASCDTLHTKRRHIAIYVGAMYKK